MYIVTDYQNKACNAEMPTINSFILTYYYYIYNNFRMTHDFFLKEQHYVQILDTFEKRMFSFTMKHFQSF